MLYEADLHKAHMPKDRRLDLIQGLSESELVQPALTPLASVELEEAAIRKRKKKRGSLTSARN